VLIFLATVFLVLAVFFAGYILYKNPKKGVNRLFAYFSVPVIIWCFGFIFMTSATDKVSAGLWCRIMISGWGFFEPLILHISLRITDNSYAKKHPWIYVPIYLPSFVMVYLHVGKLAFIKDFIHTTFGWTYIYKKDLCLILINNIHIAVYILATLVLLYRSYRKSADIIYRRQIRVIFMTIVISVVAFFLITYVPVLFHIQPFSYLDLIIVQIWVLGLSYAIIRYGFMVISPETAASSIIKTMADGLLLTDRAGVIVSVNPSLFRLLQGETKTIVGNPVESIFPAAFTKQHFKSLLVSGNIVQDMETSVSSTDGNEICVSLSASAVTDKWGRKTGYVVILHDISERKRTEKQLQHMATHDTLTNLPNRTIVNDRLRNAISRAKRHKQIVGLLLIDVDKFKNINDTFGHDAGDKILKQVAAGLNQSIRDYDTVARMGGDEFIIILSDLKDRKDCDVVIERIRSSFSRPKEIGKQRVIVTLSIGVSICPDHAENIEDLMKFADLALYRVKASGRNDFQLYSPEFDAEARKNIHMEQELGAAITHSQLELYYQPIYATFSGKLMSVEALLRWNHPRLGLIGPMDFISLAERSGLIVPIGEWVLNQACRQQKKWIQLGFKGIPVTVNISARQFQDPQLISKIEGAVRDSGIGPQLLELELTETTAMLDIERTIEIVKKLKESGISIIIDDFGSGYSSMAWLKQLNVRAIKIDRFFIQNIAHDPYDAAIVKAVVSMAHSIGIQVVAEGIETVEQLDALKSMRWDVSTKLSCDWVQGYLFSKPVAADMATELFRNINPYGD